MDFLVAAEPIGFDDTASPCISATVMQTALADLHTALAGARRTCASRRVAFRARWIVEYLLVACVTGAATSARLRQRQLSLAVVRSRKLKPESIAGLSYTGNLSAGLARSLCAERHISADVFAFAIVLLHRSLRQGLSR
jgi:hypothetical protein